VQPSPLTSGGGGKGKRFSDLTPWPSSLRGKGENLAGYRVSLRRWATGAQGDEAPMARGVGGVPPQNQKRGRVAHISNPTTSGTQNAGEP